jgi:hypothetical protein
MSAKVDRKKLQFQSIFAAHMVFSVLGHEKTPMTAAADRVAYRAQVVLASFPVA